MTRVAIIGAGVCGLAAAMRLAEAGCAVSVHEASARLGDNAASWLAGGMLAPFCEAESADASIIEPGLSGIEWWAGQTGSLCRNGTLVVDASRGNGELRRFAARTREFCPVDAEGIAQLEPALAGRFQNGLFYAEEAHLQPRVALDDLAGKLASRGARLHFGEAVSPDALDADFVIDCRGVAAAAEGLRPVRGEMLLVACPEITLSRPVRLLHPRWPIYVVPHGEGRFMIGATMVESGDTRQVTLRSAVELMNVAYALNPAFADAEILELRAGLRPAFADNLPRLVQVTPRIAALAGAYRHGFLLAPHLAASALAHIQQQRSAA